MRKELLFTVLLLAFIGIASCSSEPTAAQPEVKVDNNKIKQELQRIADDKSNIKLWHLNRERAQMMDKRIEQLTDPAQKFSLIFKASSEWLNAGEYGIAIKHLEDLKTFIAAENIKVSDRSLNGIDELLGMAYLRKAEVENCLQFHNEYSCILPIEEGGQHVNKEGAQAAAKVFEEILIRDPENMTVKWLYNIAQMTLGNYPQNVSKDKLISPSIFESETTFPRFTDVAMSSGVAIDQISGSIVMEDFNNDMFLDLLVSSYGLDDQLRYFENDGKGSYIDKTEKAGLIGLYSGLNMVQADYNNDGWVDVYILRGAWLGADGTHPNSLLKNNGDGSFTDVTMESGMYTKFPTQTATWLDFNNDGWLDLFVGNEFSANIKASTQLFVNNKNGTFSEVAAQHNAQVNAFTKGCIASDYDNDGNMDIYLSLITGENILLHNEGADKGYTFVNKAKESKTTLPLFSFPTWFFDYDQDGWEDLFVSGFDFRQFESAGGEVAKDYLGLPTSATKPKLYRNNRDGSFTDVTSKVGVDKVLFTMGCNFGDLDNDGFLDFYTATGTPDFRALIPNRMFLNKGGNQFYDVTKAGGFGHLQKGHGVAFGDVDNDGDQDVYNVLGGSYDGDNFMNALFLNPGNDNNWIKIKLVGQKANTSAIGARLELTVTDENGAQRKIHSRINSGGSFGANPLRAEIGLGSFTKIEKLVITWPGSGTVETISNLQINSMYSITENSDKAVQLKMISAPLKQMKHHH